MDPSYINYDDEPDESASGWTHSVFRKHWYNCYIKANGSRPRWGVKEATLLTKLMREYPPKELKEMMQLAATSPHHSLVAFYSTATDWHQFWKDTQEEWKWS